jgi:hypothetical protein
MKPYPLLSPLHSFLLLTLSLSHFVDVFVALLKNFNTLIRHLHRLSFELNFLLDPLNSSLDP